VAKLTLQLCDEKTLVNRLAFCMKQSCKSGSPCGPGTYLPLTLIALPSLAHILGCSKELRAEVCMHSEIFEGIHHILSKRMMDILPYPMIGALRSRSSDFLHAVAACKDMERCLIGRDTWRRWQGYLVQFSQRLMITRQKCFMGLTQMLENKEVCRLVRERGGFQTLAPVSGTLKAIFPACWDIMQAQIMEDDKGARPYTKEEKKDTQKWAISELSTPKVCAYPLCNTTTEPSKRCGRCQLAYYCR
jgi:hypothetical protein